MSVNFLKCFHSAFNQLFPYNTQLQLQYFSKIFAKISSYNFSRKKVREESTRRNAAVFVRKKWKWEKKGENFRAEMSHFLFFSKISFSSVFDVF